MRALRRSGWAAGLVLLPAVAWAHPFAARITAHQLQLVLTPDVIRIDYTVETPLAPPPGPAGEINPLSLDLESTEEVASGFLLQANGHTLPLRPDPELPPKARKTAKTEVVRLGLVAPAPAQPVVTLRLSNANYPDLPSYFRTSVLVDPLVQVQSSSLFLVDPLTGVTHDEDAAWHPGDQWRTLTLKVRYRRGGLALAYRRLEGTEGTLIGAWESRPRSPWRAWLDGGMQPGLLLVLTAIATALGTAVRSGGRRAVFEGCAAGAVPAVLLAVLPGALWPSFALAGALGAGALAVYTLRGGPHRLAPLGGIGALALATHHGGFAALLAVGATIGVLLGRARRDSSENPPSGAATAIAVLAIVLLLVIRSLGGLLGTA